METTQAILQTEIYHRDFNLTGRDNLDELPTEEAVFGIFAIVDHEIANCRYIGEAENLRGAVKELFEHPPGTGMARFMRGGWVQMILYVLMPGSSPEERQVEAGAWISKYDPRINDNGEYPGYYS